MALLKTERLFPKVVFERTQRLQQSFLKGVPSFVLAGAAVSAVCQALTGLAQYMKEDLSHNAGIAFGAFSYSANFSLWASIVFGFTLVGIAWKRQYLRPPLVLILGGGISNGIDRLLFGFVRDPIYILTWQGNAADLCIAIGVLWAILVMYNHR